MTTDERDIGDDDSREIDELVSRMVDDVATESDRMRFDVLAAGMPDLWRQLALAQRDMALLREAYECETARAVDLDLDDLSRSRVATSPLRNLVAFGGWAAAVLIGLWWGMLSVAAGPNANGRIVDEQRPHTTLTPEQHLAKYLNAPYVLGTMQPLVLEVEELSDGRLAVQFIRRVEEVALLDPSDLPIDEFGELTSDATRLRSVEPNVSGWGSTE